MVAAGATKTCRFPHSAFRATAAAEASAREMWPVLPEASSSSLVLDIYDEHAHSTLVCGPWYG
jgi:hypothetical protein